ncbi:membrane protein DedA with SNARE-associated domain [Pseudoduganella flava]|uniref:Membrane protein DedA with SNARE-associated domain n=1 Tax=Pseudoduganella flava TaxID=871742 RepID=A0A562Q3Y9_9BURK|nr:DedA family protein/thiosulfate sulfurtransferase GlpE [Pseudoduganella flava]QGZ41477.1 sulfurtransferase [Pseudoduganella flava]TWI51438.1 membrane protein DedA with SNARE-associated domain [Pseudoduganella flava]
MANLISLLQEYGVLIVFIVVLVEQMGAPIPAYPILIVSGALAMNGGTPLAGVLAVAMSACLLADLFWFRAGRRYGKRILKLLCRISLSPDYCVSQTEDNFRKWGPKSMIVAKFIPGFNTIAPPLAGAMGTGVPLFLSFSLLGGLLWSLTGILIGVYFQANVDEVLDMLATMGSTALGVLGTLLGLFVTFKYIERRRFQRAMQTERISVEQLRELVDAGHEPVMVDARSATARQLDPPVPGALPVDGNLPALLAALPHDRHIVVYCSCPNDVSAAGIVKQLHEHGYALARPLHGGLDAWKSAFRPTDTIVIAEQIPATDAPR